MPKNTTKQTNWEIIGVPCGASLLFIHSSLFTLPSKDVTLLQLLLSTMPHHYPSKKQKLEGHQDPAADGNDYTVTFDDLGVDELANVLGFLSPEDIMSKRRINKKTMEAVKRQLFHLLTSV